MPRSFLAYFGHINIDISIKVDKIPSSGSIAVNAVEEAFGGTAGNFAMVANRLGVPFHLYSTVSQKTHSKFLSFLKSEGIDTEHINISDESYGPICYIASDKEKQVAYMFQGPMDYWKLSDQYDFRESYEWAHFCTGPPQEYIKVAERLKGTKIVFDPGQELAYQYDGHIAKKFLELSTMFIGNNEEYSTLARLTRMSDNELKNACQNLIITQGSKGVMAILNGETYRFRTLKVESLHDTIGAGDSFRAGMYYGLFKKHNIVDSIIYGIIVASEAIQSPIADFGFSAEELEKSASSLRDEILIS